METTMDILTDRLVSTGMTETEVDHLLARFLQEEAFQYVEYISNHLEEMCWNKSDSSHLPS